MAAKQKVVLLLDLQGNDVKEKRKVLKAVSTYPGLDLIAVDMKQRKLTVVGLVDPIELVTKLRKHWRAYIFYVGPANKEDVPTGGVKEDGDGPPAEATANQVERPVADVRSWPHAVAVPARYPYPHHQHVAGGAQEDPHGYHYVAGGGLVAREKHDNHPDTYVTYGVRENHPKSYYDGYGAQENSPNGCAIC